MPCTCKLRRYEREEGQGPLKLHTYSFNEVREKKDEWLAEFRRVNGSHLVKIDRSFESYKRDLEDTLSTCRCV